MEYLAVADPDLLPSVQLEWTWFGQDSFTACPGLQAEEDVHQYHLLPPLHQHLSPAWEPHQL